MNEKIAKMVVKGAVSLGVSALIGYMIKMERRLEQSIDDHYANENN
jgi:methylthioribose-1-phosphate isomerase